MTELTIGKVAERAGVGVETVRFYERKGLLDQPHRPDRGFRVYPEAAIDRIRFIRRAQELGFNLADARNLLELRADPTSDCAAVQSRASTKLADVHAKIAQLNRLAKALERIVEACPGKGTLDCCSIMAAMEDHDSTTGRQHHG